MQDIQAVPVEAIRGHRMPGTELKMVVNYCVGARTQQTLVLCKMSQPELLTAKPSLQTHTGVL